MEAEVEAFIGEHADLSDDTGHRRVVRHVYLPERSVQTGIGPVAVRRPRVRDRQPEAIGGRIRFTSSILPPYLGRARSVDELLPWLRAWRDPSFVEIDDLIIARIGRPPITPSPRFNYSFQKGNELRHASHKSCLPDIERIHAQLNKLAQMIKDERYCLDIIAEMKGIRNALKDLQNSVLQDHIDHCLERAAGDPSEKSRVTAEVMKLLEAAAS